MKLKISLILTALILLFSSQAYAIKIGGDDITNLEKSDKLVSLNGFEYYHVWKYHDTTKIPTIGNTIKNIGGLPDEPRSDGKAKLYLNYIQTPPFDNDNPFFDYTTNYTWLIDHIKTRKMVAGSVVYNFIPNGDNGDLALDWKSYPERANENIELMLLFNDKNITGKKEMEDRGYRFTYQELFSLINPDYIPYLNNFHSGSTLNWNIKDDRKTSHPFTTGDIFKGEKIYEQIGLIYKIKDEYVQLRYDGVYIGSNLYPSDSEDDVILCGSNRFDNDWGYGDNDFDIENPRRIILENPDERINVIEEGYFNKVYESNTQDITYDRPREEQMTEEEYKVYMYLLDTMAGFIEPMPTWLDMLSRVSSYMNMNDNYSKFKMNKNLQKIGDFDFYYNNYFQSITLGKEIMEELGMVFYSNTSISTEYRATIGYGYKNSDSIGFNTLKSGKTYPIRDLVVPSEHNPVSLDDGTVLDSSKIYRLDQNDELILLDLEKDEIFEGDRLVFASYMFFEGDEFSTHMNYEVKMDFAISLDDQVDNSSEYYSQYSITGHRERYTFDGRMKRLDFINQEFANQEEYMFIDKINVFTVPIGTKKLQFQSYVSWDNGDYLSSNNDDENDNFDKNNDYNSVIVEVNENPLLVVDAFRNQSIQNATIFDELGNAIYHLTGKGLNSTISLERGKNYYVGYEVLFETDHESAVSKNNLEAKTTVYYEVLNELNSVSPVDSRELMNGNIIHYGLKEYWTGSDWINNSNLKEKDWDRVDYSNTTNMFEIIGKNIKHTDGAIKLELPLSVDNQEVNEFDSSIIRFTFDNEVDYGVALGYLYTPSKTFTTKNSDGYSYGYDRYNLSGVAIEAKVKRLSGEDNWTPEITFEVITSSSGDKTSVRINATEELNASRNETIVKYVGGQLMNSQGYLEISAEIERVDADIMNNHTDTAMNAAEAGQGWECGSVSDTLSKTYLDMVDFFVKNFEVSPDTVFTNGYKQVKFNFMADVGLIAGGESFAKNQGMYPEPIHVGWAMEGTKLWEDTLYLSPFNTEMISGEAPNETQMGNGISKTFLITINGGDNGFYIQPTTTRQYEEDYSNNYEVIEVYSSDVGTECTIQCGGGNIDSYNAWSQEIFYSNYYRAHTEQRTGTRKDGSSYTYTVCVYDERTMDSQVVSFWERYDVSMDIRETNTSTWKSMLSGTPTIKAGRMFELRILGHYSTNRYSSMLWGKSSGSCASSPEYPDPTSVYSDVYACMRLSDNWKYLTPNVKDPNYSDVIYYPYSSTGSSYDRINEYRLYDSPDSSGLNRHAFKSDVSLPDQVFYISFKNQPFRGTGKYDSNKDDDDLLQKCITNASFKIKDSVEIIHEIYGNN